MGSMRRRLEEFREGKGPLWVSGLGRVPKLVEFIPKLMDTFR